MSNQPVARRLPSSPVELWALAHTQITQKPNSLFTRLFIFGSIGLLTMVGYFLMYALVSLVLNAQVSNLLTLITMTVINTALNRRFTFKRRGRERAHIHYLAGAVAFGLSWGVSALGIWLLFKINPDVPHLVETVWVTLFSLTATVVKYAVFAVGFREPKSTDRQDEARVIEPVIN